MFKPISGGVRRRQENLAKYNSNHKAVSDVVSDFLDQTLNIPKGSINLTVSLESGNLYLSTPSKSLANEIVFLAKPLYTALKKNNIVCNNLIIR